MHRGEQALYCDWDPFDFSRDEDGAGKSGAAGDGAGDGAPVHERTLSLLCALCDGLGGAVVGGMCENYCSDWSAWQGGVADLLLWRPRPWAAAAGEQQLEVRLCEVKGPNDKLSARQEAWIDCLVRLGADVEVMHVVNLGT